MSLSFFFLVYMRFIINVIIGCGSISGSGVSMVHIDVLRAVWDMRHLLPPRPHRISGGYEGSSQRWRCRVVIGKSIQPATRHICRPTLEVEHCPANKPPAFGATQEDGERFQLKGEKRKVLV